jgi:site-specific DNA recombinase
VSIESYAVKTACELYATGGYLLKQVRLKIIKEYGITRTSGQWDKALKNPFYTEVMKIKGKLYPRHYETVISEDLFEQAKAVREGHAVKPKRWAGQPYTYRGLIFCSECGCNVTFEKKKGKFVYGHCTQFKGRHNSSYVAENAMTDQLRSVFKQIQMPEEAIVEILKAMMADYEKISNENRQKLSHVETEIKRSDNKIERNYDIYLDGGITQEMYQRKHQELLANKRALESTRKNIELMTNNNFEGALDLLRLWRKSPDLFENAEIEEKRILINQVHSNLELNDKELRWELKEPYDCMVLCSETQNWLPIVDVLRTFMK